SASSFAADIPSREISHPVNVEFGNALPMRLIACPLPHPISKTLIPFFNLSVIMGFNCRIWLVNLLSKILAVSSAWSCQNFGYSEYGRPPPFRKHSTILSSTIPIRDIYWANTAKLSTPDFLVRKAECSFGRLYFLVVV